MDMIRNRFEKNLKKLKPWADRNRIEAFRLYDRDIPEFPFIVDIYKDFLLVYDKSDAFLDQEKNHLPKVIEALRTLFNIEVDNIIVKKRERQEGLQQYEKISEKAQTFVVRESQAIFKVNLYDYLDTGLFLDHRPMRYKIFKLAAGKKFLNLFCYTGSVSIFAALAGARTTNVDMSKTYITWAQENFVLNKLLGPQHEFVVANALLWMNEHRDSHAWDLIFLDPPTFSNSKKMSENFDVERDQVMLLEAAMSLLKPGGTLYFSNNKRKFKLDQSILDKYEVRDLTEESIPQDFHDKKIHQCYEIKTKNLAPIDKRS